MTPETLRTDRLLLDVLAQIHRLTTDGMNSLRAAFLDTERTKATLNPGMFLGFALPSDEALALDQKALLGTQVRTKIRAAFALWGEGWPSHPIA